MFFSPSFGNQYNVFSDIFIDHSGIHDGPILHSWGDVASCNIGESDVEDLKRCFGDDFYERPYALMLTHKDGTLHNITLFGQGLDKIVETGKAINYYSGVEMFSRESLEGKTTSLLIIIGAILAIAAVTTFMII